MVHVFFVFSYCGTNGPNPVTLTGRESRKGLRVLFLSDKKTEGGGAQCTAQCLDGLSVLLMTGGGTKGVEIYDPVSKTSCALPALPKVRALHSQDGPLLCGGNEATHLKPLKTCMLFNSGALDIHHLSIS